MSYRIDYEERTRKKCIILPILTMGCFLSFLLLVYGFWPEGFAVIQSAFQMVKCSWVVSALDQFALRMVEETETAEAFSEFLRGLLP